MFNKGGIELINKSFNDEEDGYRNVANMSSSEGL